MTSFIRRQAAKLVTFGIAATLCGFALPPRYSNQDLKALADTLAFSATYLDPADTRAPMRTMREVHPSVKRIDAWVSSVGAAIALADISGSGRPADICLVDPRNDSVSVMPAPGTGQRFASFALKLPTEGYDPRTIAPMGCLPADVNEDGQMDLIIYFWGRTPVVYLRNQSVVFGPESFDLVELVAAKETWNTNAAILADVDGSGHPALIFGNYYPDSEHVLDAHATESFEMQRSMSRGDNGGGLKLLMWQGSTARTVSYRDATDSLPPETRNGWTLALAARDLTGDLLPEIYVANDFGPNRLLLNRSQPGSPRFEVVEGRRDFKTPRSKVLGQGSFKGMGVDFIDLLGDGTAAIAVSNISSPYALLESHFLFVNTGDQSAWARGEAPYRDQSYERGTWTSGWAWDIKSADLTNSGVPAIIQAIGFVHGEQNRWPELQELAMGNDDLLRHPAAWPRFSAGDDLSGHDHDRLFLQDREGRYHDVWPLLGLDTDTVSRGIATADVFGDGRLSLAIARQWGPSLFLQNISKGTGQAVVLDLRVPGAVAGTRAAIGAEARVHLPTGRIVTDVVDGGSGHSGKRASEVHLGLGQVSATSQFCVDIKWRDASGVHIMTPRLAPGRYQIVLNSGVVEAASPTKPTP